MSNGVSDPPDFDALWNYADPAESERAFIALLPAARSSGDAAYLGQLLTQVARAQGLRDKFDEARSTLDEVTDLTGAAPLVRIRYLLERGRVFNSSGRADDSRPLFLDAWQLASAAGEEYHAADAAHMLGIVEPSERQLEWKGPSSMKPRHHCRFPKIRYCTSPGADHDPP
jgi:hypothetical protein